MTRDRSRISNYHSRHWQHDASWRHPLFVVGDPFLPEIDQSQGARLLGFYGGCSPGFWIRISFIRLYRRFQTKIWIRVRIQKAIDYGSGSILSPLSLAILLSFSTHSQDCLKLFPPCLLTLLSRIGVISFSSLKGAVSRDFRTLFFFINRTHLGPW